jgi:periplasmic copper chaperone A
MSTRRTTLPIAPLVACALLVSVGLTACSSGGAGTASGTLTVTGAWVRTPNGDSTAAYFTIANGTSTDDVLVGVSTPAAQSASLHRTTTDSSGMTGMQMTSEIHVPAGGTVSLAPGGFHVMMMGLAGGLKAGSTVQLILTFEHAGVLQVDAEVRAS